MRICHRCGTRAGAPALSELLAPCPSRYADTPFARRHVCGGQQQMLAAQLWRLVAPQPPGAVTARHR
ncbi:hypothetical protein XcvCFBP7111P_21700 [Xanthomonas citri pv. vignicola]|uniref:Uncharacterized protein n=1 Tax=Xanthomonas citri pv. vignicola TaxID=473426 RepID=A0AB33CLD1_XANCI|nr:hypothetical protein XcvCFBP7111P_21700 [Xanthomonas citri pv. vignicola]